LRKVELITHVATRYALNKLKIFWFTRAEQKVWKIIVLPQKVQPEEMGYLKELYTLLRGNSLKNKFQ